MRGADGARAREREMKEGWRGGGLERKRRALPPTHLLPLSPSLASQGWAFDGTGTLRSVPAAEHAGEWPAKPLVDTYPVAEKGGFVWLFYGAASLPVDERPPIPFVPELEDPSWKAVYGEIEFECDHWGVFENAIDMAHVSFPSFVCVKGEAEKRKRGGWWVRVSRPPTRARARARARACLPHSFPILSLSPFRSTTSTPTPLATRPSRRSATCTSRPTRTA